MYNVFILECQKTKTSDEIVQKEQKQVSFYLFFMVSSVKTMLILLPFFTIAQHESGTRKTVSWLVTALNKIESS